MDMKRTIAILSVLHLSTGQVTSVSVQSLVCGVLALTLAVGSRSFFALTAAHAVAHSASYTAAYSGEWMLTDVAYTIAIAR